MPVLETTELCVRFGGNMAVNQVSLEVGEGEITGLIGPNGAGKTTTFNVITGLLGPTAGKVTFQGNDITSTRAHKRAHLGMARTFQRLEVFGSLTVRENIQTSAEIRRRWSRDRSARPERDADDILDQVGLRSVSEERADSLPTGLARLVELGRALASRPKVLLLDEPASGLDEGETGTFANLLSRVAADGMAVLLVEHDVPLVMRLCAQVYVLNFGEVLASGTPKEIQNNQSVLDAYIGEAPVAAGGARKSAS